MSPYRDPGMEQEEMVEEDEYDCEVCDRKDGLCAVPQVLEESTEEPIKDEFRHLMATLEPSLCVDDVEKRALIQYIITDINDMAPSLANYPTLMARILEDARVTGYITLSLSTALLEWQKTHNEAHE